MKTLHCKLQTANFLKLLVFLFVFTILHFTVLSFNLPSVFAQSRLQYPIPDLGYCRDAKECYLYCEIPQNKAACWSYGKYTVGSDVLGVTTMSEDEKEMMRQKAKEYSITFPIAELGNCAGPQECRDFCEQAANQQNCMDFAKKKGFHKEVEGSEGVDTQKRDELLQKAKTELGCTSMESCSRICESDQSRCESFAKKHSVYKEPPDSSGRYSVEKKALLMEKARTELGCTSMESCKAACEQSPRVCMAFAQKYGFDQGRESRELDGSRQDQQGTPSGIAPNYGIKRFGKGSCDSEESCKKYCEEHPDECPGLKGYTRAVEGSGSSEVSGKKYVGPSGCRTEAECNSWCQSYPDKCPGFRDGKAREESAKREYELKKKQAELYQESQKQQFEDQREKMQQNYEYRSPSSGSQESGGGSQYYPSTPGITSPIP